ncbi:MAG: serine/threonine protein kinase [Deltaproteobacteria bacterium]|nr:serine/threonine protein kinase [Deltaproteobacteria bacterium]
MPPRQIGPYRVLHPLGSGGVGTVFRAQDIKRGGEVALKLLSTGGAMDPLAARRLAREFETLYELDHPNIVRVFDAGVYQGYPYLAMELIEGLDLKRYLDLDSAPISAPIADIFGTSLSDVSGEVPRFDLDQMGEEVDTDALGISISTGAGVAQIRALADAADEPFTDEEEAAPPVQREESDEAPAVKALAAPDLELLNRAERIGKLKDALLQICEALAYMHGKGLVHRDLKPANVMVDDDRHVRVMDFGLAKFLAEEEPVTATGKIVGTYRYMAPEQLLGEKLDPRADLYSLGVMIYELITGRVPFSAKTPLDLWDLILNSEAPPVFALNPQADEQLARIATRLLRKDAGERYQTAEEVFQVLMDG